MYKCPLELAEDAVRHKLTDARIPRRLIARRLRFETLLGRDRAVWMRVSSPDALRAIAVEVQRELAWGEYPQFIAWASEHLGLGLCRAAGLVQGPPRLVVSA
jgi:hypothetical protein